MSDSFFTGRNQVDPQIETATVQFCSDLIDAATRRIAKLEGPLGAAVRVQRISDICSGAHVLPIEHWSKLDAPKPSEPASAAPAKSGFVKRIGKHISDGTVIAFWVGFSCGCITRGGS
ncbi:hypothetical protein [Mesorhizobium sp. M0058]|uniref:hypothetical protein n=1 Tax=Mesorhizobium sp. M0058 TaxID=2956865 RepID=UPI0033386CA1